MGNDDVKPLGRILTDGGAGIHRFAHPLADSQLDPVFGLGLHLFQGVIHGLAPGHIIDSAGKNESDFEFLCFGGIRFRGGRFLVAAAAGYQQGKRQYQGQNHRKQFSGVVHLSSSLFFESALSMIHCISFHFPNETQDRPKSCCSPQEVRIIPARRVRRAGPAPPVARPGRRKSSAPRW